MKRFLRSASSASRWLVCGGSIAACKGLSGFDDEYSREGTTAHTLLADCLRGRTLPEFVSLCKTCSRASEGGCSFCGTESVVKDYDMPRHVGMVVAFVRQLKQNDVQYIGIEEEVQSATVEDFGGHVDCFVIYRDRTSGKMTLHVMDMKYGMGVWVKTDGNDQLFSYLLLLWERYPNIRHFRATIIQPRVGDGLPYTIDVTLDQLKAFRRQVVASTLDEELKSGPHCHFCEAADGCPEVMTTVEELVATIDEELEEQRRDLWPKFMAMESVIRRLLITIPKRMLEAMKKGIEFEGWKAIESISRRKWIDDDEKVAESLLEAGVPEEYVYQKKLTTPAQLEKSGYTNEARDLWFKPRGGVKIVPAGHRSPAVAVKDLDFGDLDDE